MTKDDTNKTVTLGADELLDLLKSAISANALSAEKIAEITAAASIKAAGVLSNEWRSNDGGNQITGVNPLGERDHPRPDLNGEFIFAGQALTKEMLTREEIELLNGLQPGLYHMGQWKVTNLVPGDPSQRKLRIDIPCRDEDTRANLPPSLAAMLQEMVSGGAGTAA